MMNTNTIEFSEIAPINFELDYEGFAIRRLPLFALSIYNQAGQFEREVFTAATCKPHVRDAAERAFGFSKNIEIRSIGYGR